MRRELSVLQSSNGSGVCCKRALEACKRGSEALQSVLVRGPTWVPLAPRGVLKSDKPVLLDFWAEWGGPCKMIAPILDEIASEYQDRIKVAKINIDENPQTPPKFGIRGIPTLILFKNGTVEAQKVGAVSKSQLSAFLDSNLREAISAIRAATGPTRARATAIVTAIAATDAPTSRCRSRRCSRSTTPKSSVRPS